MFIQPLCLCLINRLPTSWLVCITKLQVALIIVFLYAMVALLLLTNMCITIRNEVVTDICYKGSSREDHIKAAPSVQCPASAVALLKR